MLALENALPNERKDRRVSHNTIRLVILAVASGAIGGFIQSTAFRTESVHGDSHKVIRTSGLEILDAAGNRIGFLGIDEANRIGLSFFDTHGKKRAEFGLGRGESPRLDINSPDGNSLLSLDLGQHARPRLIMSDNDFNGRVYIGVVEPDAPSPDWKYDNWVLRFTGDNTRPLAIVGMTTHGAGGVAVFDQSGRRWKTPLK